MDLTPGITTLRPCIVSMEINESGMPIGYPYVPLSKGEKIREFQDMKATMIRGHGS